MINRPGRLTYKIFSRLSVPGIPSSRDERQGGLSTEKLSNNQKKFYFPIELFPKKCYSLDSYLYLYYTKRRP